MDSISNQEILHIFEECSWSSRAAWQIRYDRYTYSAYWAYIYTYFLVKLFNSQRWKRREIKHRKFTNVSYHEEMYYYVGVWWNCSVRLQVNLPAQEAGYCSKEETLISCTHNMCVNSAPAVSNAAGNSEISGNLGNIYIPYILWI